jgi:hypothetical protein
VDRINLAQNRDQLTALVNKAIIAGSHDILRISGVVEELLVSQAGFRSLEFGMSEAAP